MGEKIEKKIILDGRIFHSVMAGDATITCNSNQKSLEEIQKAARPLSRIGAIALGVMIGVILSEAAHWLL